MANKSKNFSNQVLAGALLIGLGCLFLFDNFGWFSIHHSTWLWPLILVVVGAYKVAQEPGGRGARFGGVLIAIGLIIFCGKLGLFQLSMRLLFPCILIGLGIMLLNKQGNPPGSPGRTDYQDPAGDTARREAAPSGGVSLEKNDFASHNQSGNDHTEPPLDIACIFSGYKRKVTSAWFSGGQVNTIFGGVELDLRQTSINGEVEINVFAMFGGIELKVPTDWTVILQGMPMMASFDEKTVHPPHGNKRLVIKGSAIFGAVEVRN